jgi:ubiquinone/menaquinone biosynthesis C-methylase UbiE
MPRTADELVAGHYFLGVAGLALIRYVLTEPDSVTERVDDVTRIVETMEEFPNDLVVPMVRHDVEEGYTKWSESYDGPNPAITSEELLVHPILESLPVGDALDAACGTGRHAAKLRELGHRVIGVDGTRAMLEKAMAKVPEDDFRDGRLEAVPVDDDSVDLITCSLELTHVPDLGPVIREFARVLRPGGTIVLADIHPVNTLLGGGLAGWPSGDITKGVPYVVNLTHQISDYVAAFNAAGLTIVDCIESFFGDAQIEGIPSYVAVPDATRQAYAGIPFLLVWRLRL